MVIKQHFQKAEPTSNWINPWKSMIIHIIIKCLKTNSKGKNVDNS